MYELELLIPGEVGPRLIIGGKVLFIGRGAQCDLVLPDEAVSTRHLAIWVGDGRLFVEDLRSRNGTKLNGAPLLGRAEASSGDTLELGASTRMVVRALTEEGVGEELEQPLVEDLASGAAYPIRSERFVLGSSVNADVYIPGAGAVEVVLMATGTGEIWLGEDAEDRPLAPGEVFHVHGRAFRLRLPQPDGRRTRELASASWPYLLRVSRGRGTGPVAWLSDQDTGAAIELRAETRAVLVYLLARRWQEDEEARVPMIERGWLSEADAATGIWGRSGSANPSAALNVLVHRIRKDLEAGGLDPWCLEKRQRALRLRVARVEIQD